MNENRVIDCVACQVRKQSHVSEQRIRLSVNLLSSSGGRRSGSSYRGSLRLPDSNLRSGGLKSRLLLGSSIFSMFLFLFLLLFSLTGVVQASSRDQLAGTNVRIWYKPRGWISPVSYMKCPLVRTRGSILHPDP